jgi:hypothetical protein
MSEQIVFSRGGMLQNNRDVVVVRAGTQQVARVKLLDALLS